MRALLLSAGLGTRLKPFTLNTPKCLIKINEKPLLQYWLDLLFVSGIEKILINTHYLSNQVEDFLFRSKYRNKIEIAYEKNLLGTGGTLLQNKNFFDKEDFLVAHSDNLCLCNFKDLIKSHFERPQETIMTMMTFLTKTPRTCGIVEIDKKKIVRKFYEKIQNPPSNLANAAVYIFSYEIFDYIEKNSIKLNDISLDLLPTLMNKISTWHNNIYNIDIGTPDSLNESRTDIKKYENFITNTLKHE